MFDDVERVNTNESLFKINLSNLFIRKIHINTNKFDVEKFTKIMYRLKIMMKVAFPSIRKNIKNRTIIEVIEVTRYFASKRFTSA